MNTTIEERYIWLNGEILSLPDAKINVLSPTAQFGANVFEGIRCYWNEEEQQLYAFRLEDHYRRLKKSMKLFRMEEKYTEEELKNALLDVVRANDYRENIAVRQTVFIDGFGSWGSGGPVGMFVAPVPKGKLSAEYNKKGLNCCISSWERISDRNLSPRIKVGANYINSRMAQMEAKENGYDSAILMNHLGKIAEGPGSCLFMVRDGVLITPPVTASILESITRDTVMVLAKEVLNIPVMERDIDRTELYICDEAFLCGSAMEITPILKVDGYVVGDEKAGKLTQQLHENYLEVVLGKNENYRRWITKIYE
ncbi:MAG: branched-chain amino acid transaminase [Acetivibrio ethanolgignens]